MNEFLSEKFISNKFLVWNRTNTLEKENEYFSKIEFLKDYNNGLKRSQSNVSSANSIEEKNYLKKN